MFGMLYSLKDFVKRISPSVPSVPCPTSTCALVGAAFSDSAQALTPLLVSVFPTSTHRYEGFRHYITGSYKLNCVESMTGLKLVLTTDVNVGDIQQDLREIYKVSPSNHKAVAVAKDSRVRTSLRVRFLTLSQLVPDLH
jgi:hypothetical protein